MYMYMYETYISGRWGVVDTAGREVVLLHSCHFRTVEFTEDAQQCTPVPVVCDTPTIVTLASEISNGGKRDFLMKKGVGH